MVGKRTLLATTATLVLSAPAIMAAPAPPPTSVQNSQGIRTIRAQLLYSSSLAQATLIQTTDERAILQRVEIEKLQDALREAQAALRTGRAQARKDQSEIRRLSAEVDRLVALLTDAQEELLAHIAERDSVFAAALAHLRGEVDNVLKTPEGRAAVERILAGDAEAGAALLDRLNAARAAARRAASEQAVKIAEAADERSAAEVLVGKLPTTQMIARYESIVAKDPNVEWDWIRLADLHAMLGDYVRATEAARRALALARTGAERVQALAMLVGTYARSGREEAAVAVLEAHLRDLESSAAGGDDPDMLQYRGRLSLIAAQLYEDRDPKRARSEVARAVAYLRRVPAGASPDEVLVAYELGAAGEIFRRQGDGETAWLLANEAVVRARAGLAAAPTDERKIVLAAQLIETANIAALQHRYAAAFGAGDEGVALWRTLPANTVQPGRIEPGLAWALQTRASIRELFLSLQGQRLWEPQRASAETIADRKEAVALLRSLQKTEAGFTFILAESLGELAEALENSGQYPEAEAAQREQVELVKALAAADPGNAHRRNLLDLVGASIKPVERPREMRDVAWPTARTMNCMPEPEKPQAADGDTGTEEEDREDQSRALPLLRSITAADPGNLAMREGLALALWRNGLENYFDDHQPSAETLEALTTARALVAEDPADLGFKRLLALILGSVEHRLTNDGKLAQAALLSLERLALLEAVAAYGIPSDLEDHAEALTNAAEIARKTGNAKAAAAYEDRALEIERRLFAADPIDRFFDFDRRLDGQQSQALADGAWSLASALTIERIRTHEQHDAARAAAGLDIGNEDAVAIELAEALFNASTPYERAESHGESVAARERALALLRPLFAHPTLGERARQLAGNVLESLAIRHWKTGNRPIADKLSAEAAALKGGADTIFSRPSRRPRSSTETAIDLLWKGDARAAKTLIDDELQKRQATIEGCSPNQNAFAELTELYGLEAQIADALGDVPGAMAARDAAMRAAEQRVTLLRGDDGSFVWDMPEALKALAEVYRSRNEPERERAVRVEIVTRARAAAAAAGTQPQGPLSVLRRPRISSSSPPERYEALAEALTGLGNFHLRQNERAEAVSALDESIAQYRHAIALEAAGPAIERFGLKTRDDRILGHLEKIFAILGELKRTEAARSVQREMLVIRQRKAERDPGNIWLQLEVAWLKGRIASDLQGTAALRALRARIAEAQKLALRFPGVPEAIFNVAEAHADLGWKMRTTDPRAAEAAIVEALRTCGQLGRDYPGDESVKDSCSFVRELTEFLMPDRFEPMLKAAEAAKP